MVRSECEQWRRKGKNVRYERRSNRAGYKAGALVEGMRHAYVASCEHIAMFDADFQPASDFLARAVPFLARNPAVALVQARWQFVNAGECLLTRMQEMSTDYHFKVEQESGSTSCAFFGYNGTTGVWRIRAITEAGGWKDRTTVEDMDLAVRAGLAGCKFVYIGNIKVKSELPSTFNAYHYQQHRWSCGPANLFRKMVQDIIQAKFHAAEGVGLEEVLHDLPFLPGTEDYLAYGHLLLLHGDPSDRLTVFFHEVEKPKWGVVYIPTAITLMNAVGTKVLPFNYLLGIVRECHVLAPL